MKLSTAQIKYAQNRLAEIVGAKLKAKEVPTPPRPELNMSLKDMYTSAVLRPYKELVRLEEKDHIQYEKMTPSKAFRLLFSFPEHEAALKEWNTKYKSIKAANDKYAATIERKAAKVMDRIMLSGDAEGALKMLDAFAAEE